ncbi:MAG: terminase family protein, partial [Halobacteriales archaeon]|nr:terminase family protein [Halobacteriales archaeon]
MDRPDHPSSTAGLREEALSISNDPENWSMAMRFSRLPDHERQALLDDMSPAEQEALLWDWKFWARPKQIPPTECDDEMCSCGGNWRTLMVLAGRGFGKTRMGAEWVRERVEEGATRLNVVGATASDTRDIIVEGPSGIISVCPPWMGARYQPTKRRIIFEGMDDNPVVMCFSADEPDRLRDHQCEYAWVDELAAWRYEQEAWTQLMLGLRLGTFPRVIVTTTPRPTRTIKRLVRSPSTHMVTGSTYENWDNLAESFTEEIVAAYEGTRIGKQELYAIILDDSPGALWNRDLIS